MRAWRLTNPAYWRERVSNTFHGRDIFAPAAAHYASGVPAEALGERVDDIRRLPVSQPAAKDGVVTGEVVYVDHYGNLVTNIPVSMLPRKAVVEVGGERIEGLSTHYDTARPLVAIVGSHDTLEVASARWERGERRLARDGARDGAGDGGLVVQQRVQPLHQL